MSQASSGVYSQVSFDLFVKHGSKAFFFLPNLDIEKLACKILKKKVWPYIICNETLVQVFKVEITTYNTFIIFN